MPSDPGTPFHNPFAAALGALRPAPRADTPDAEAAPDPAAPASPAASRTIGRAVVRLERSGRGGKAVTVVEHLDLPPAEREAWIRDLKGALGCGGSLEGDRLVVQGDQRKRLPALLLARGVRKVTLG